MNIILVFALMLVLGLVYLRASFYGGPVWGWIAVLIAAVCIELWPLFLLVVVIVIAVCLYI